MSENALKTMDERLATPSPDHKKVDVKETHFPFWSELVGTLNIFKIDNEGLQLIIDDKMFSYPNDSEEAKYLREKLDASLIGRRIAVLRTDIPDKLLLIRLVD